MRVCATCGRTRDEAAGFCMGCGSLYPDVGPQGPSDPDGDEASAPSAIDNILGWSAGKRSAGRRSAGGKPPSRRPHRFVVAAVLVVVLAVAGTVAILLSGGHGSPQPGLPAAFRSLGAGSPSPLPGTTSAAPAASPTPVASTGPVGVAAAVAKNPDTSRILPLLDKYFAAINKHDYQSFFALFNSPGQEELSAGQFSSGFQSTVDSNETLVGISDAADGPTIAAVTFNSHQNPANSINHSEACTSWHISLFLEQDGAGYLIGKPPVSYNASYAPCP